MNDGILITTDGLTPDHNFPPTPFIVINEVYKELVTHCISGASQIGATLIMLIVVLLLTPHARRRNFIYAANLLTLVCNLVRVTTYALYFTAGLATPRGLLMGTRVDAGTGAYVNSTLSCAFNAVTVCLIEASLFWQSYKVISPAVEHRNRVIIISASVVAASTPLITSAILLGTTLNALWNGKANNVRFQIAETFAFAISICYFSLMFVVKLFSVIRFRRKIGNTKFGAMQVICLMFCQSMIVPAILLILQLIFPTTLLSSMTITIVSMSLPLTAIWANSVDNDRRNSQDKAAFPGTGRSHRTWLATTTSALGRPFRFLAPAKGIGGGSSNNNDNDNVYGNDPDKRKSDSTPYIEAKLNFSALDANFTNTSQVSTARGRGSWELPTQATHQNSRHIADHGNGTYTNQTLNAAEEGMSPVIFYTTSGKHGIPLQSDTVIQAPDHQVEPLGTNVASYPNRSRESVATTASNTMIGSIRTSAKSDSWS